MCKGMFWEERRLVLEGGGGLEMKSDHPLYKFSFPKRPLAHTVSSYPTSPNSKWEMLAATQGTIMASGPPTRDMGQSPRCP